MGMTDRYGEIAFTERVKSLQEMRGSRKAYTRRGADFGINFRLGSKNCAFIAARDTFCLAWASETGWPYVQHRDGPTGCLRVLDDRTLGYADFSRNHQYITAGDALVDNRVALLPITTKPPG